MWILGRSASTIESEIRESYVGTIRNMINHILNCNCEDTTVHGGSPCANAARWDDDIQRAFDND